MDRKKFIFIGGPHRSGTSLVHRIMRAHPHISGFTDTGVNEDEGQHLQSVYAPAQMFGGPGRFGFNKKSFMDESHPLATPDSASKLYHSWSCYWDLDREYLLEKSPPNIVRTRFLQKIFPNSMFVVLLRHPIAVSYATRKWSHSSIPSLIEHTVRCYERFLIDLPYLNRVYVLRYEDFVQNPTGSMQALYDWMGLEHHAIDLSVRSYVNKKYFEMWNVDRNRSTFWTHLQRRFHLSFRDYSARYEHRCNQLGYSLETPSLLLPKAFLGDCQTLKLKRAIE